MAPFSNTRRRRRVKSISTIPKSKPKTTTEAKKSATVTRRSNSIPKTSIKIEKEAAHLAAASSSSSSSVSGDGFDDSGIIIDSAFDSNNVVAVGNEVTVCSTPKGQRFRIPKIEACPPAPRKKNRGDDVDALFSASPSQRSSCSSLQRRPVAFFAPPDLELFFFFARRHISV